MMRVALGRLASVAAVAIPAAAAACREPVTAPVGPIVTLVWHYPSQVSCRLRAPAADSQRVYVPFADGYVRALSRTTGALQWQTLVNGSSYDDIKVLGGRIVVQVGGLGLTALDPATGSILWVRTDSTDAPRGVLSFDSVTNVVVAGGWLRSLWGIHVSDGSVAWRIDLGESARSTVIAGRTVYAGTRNDSMPPAYAFGHIFAVDLDFRVERWSFLAPMLQTSSGFAAALAAAGRVVVGNAASGRVYAVDTATGQELWHFDGDVFLGGSVSDGRLAYVPSNSGNLFARDLLTGVAAWSAFVSVGSLYTEPALLGDSLVVVKDGNTLYALQRSSGRTVWTYQIQYNNICSTPLVIGEDIVFDAEDGIYDVRAPQ